MNHSNKTPCPKNCAQFLSQQFEKRRLFSTSSTAKNMASQPRKVTHVIFDMDGLLLDTEKIYYSIIEDVLKQFDMPYPWETRMRVLGTSEKKCCRIIVNDLKLPVSANEFHKRYTELGNERFPESDLLPGAEKIIRHLHSHNIPIGLATSCGEPHFLVKTSKHRELFDLFEHKVMGSTDDDVESCKPAPDIFVVAAERFPDSPDPKMCLVFEDAPNGVKAAKAAGMQVVMVPDPKVDKEGRANATVVVDSLLDVDLEAFGLPPLPKEESNGCPKNYIM